MNKDIQNLQRWLNQRLPNESSVKPLVVDGIGGKLTREAILLVMQCKTAPAITETDLRGIARDLGLPDSRAIKAIASVESAGSGWDKYGLPTVLFERHKFWQLTTQPRIYAWFSNPAAGDYTTDSNKNGVNDSWEKLCQAACRDPIAAFQSVSIGKFQVMGMWYKQLGYETPYDMLYAASRSEHEQYRIFLGYCLHVANLKAAIQAIDGNPDNCRAFARGYNGKGYEKYAYHTKIANAYKKIKVKAVYDT